MIEQRQQWNPPPRAPLVGVVGGEDPDRDDSQLACEAETPHSRDEAAVRAVIDAIVAAVRSGDVEAMLAQCSPDVVTFDMVEPIQHEGVNSVRRVNAGLAPRDPQTSAAGGTRLACHRSRPGPSRHSAEVGT
jgi:hypothetical protein